jgi:ABC-2 type transport system permease protein
MNGIRALLALNLRALYHYFLPPRWKTYLPLIALLSLGVFLLVLEFIGFGRIFRALYKLQDFPFFFVQALLERLIGLILLISYSMILMSSMVNGLSSFFLSQNLPFLYTLPIPRWKVLSTKFVENWVNSSYLVVLFLFCFFLSHAHSFDLSATHYVRFAILLALLTLSPVAVGSTILIVLIRFFPVRRIHQLVTFVGVAFLGSLTIALRMMKPERLLNPEDTDDFVRLIQDLTIPSLNHLPSSWASRSVVYGEWLPLLFLLGFTLGSILLLCVILRLFYDRAYVFSQESRSVRGRKQNGAKPASAVNAPPRTNPVLRSLILKDLRLFLRDATQWTQLLLLAALIVVYLLNIRNLAIDLPMVRGIVSFINLGLAGFVLAALSVRFLFPSVSMEGRSFWIIKTLPISLRKMLWAKYLIYFVPFLVFGELLVYLSNRILNVEPFFMQVSALNILATCFALTGLAIGIGAFIPNFKTDHPSQIAVGPGGVFYMLLSFVYIAAMLAVQMRPVWHYQIRAVTPADLWVYPVIALVLTLIVGLVPMEWGARKLNRLEL